MGRHRRDQRSGPRWLRAVRAEVTALTHRKLVIVLIVTPAVYTVSEEYLFPLLSAHTQVDGGSYLASGALQPANLVPAVLNSTYSNIVNLSAFLLIGAFISASSWSEGTLRAGLVDLGGRATAAFGQWVAVALATFMSVLALFISCGSASGAITLTAGGRHTAVSIGALVSGGATCAVIALTYASLGMAIGTLVRAPGVAMGAVLVWSLVLQPAISGTIAPGLHDGLLRAYDVLPSAGAATLAFRYGLGGYMQYQTSAPGILSLAGWVAYISMACYIVLGLIVTMALVVRRDVT
jgi:hypothetical protein